MKENTAAVHVHLPVETATYLLNEKRLEISAIESRIGTPVIIIPTEELETPHYHIRRLRIDEYEAEADVPSYELDIVEEEEEEERRPAPTTTAAPSEKPAIGPLTHAAAPPAPPKPEQVGLLKKLIGTIFHKKEEKEEKKAATEPARPPRQHGHPRGHGGPRPPHRPHPHPHREHRGERPPQPQRSGGGQEQGRPRPPQPQQAAGGAPAEGGQPQRERHEGSGRRRGRRGRRRGGRGQEGRAPQERQDFAERNGGHDRNRRPAEETARESYVPREETAASVPNETVNIAPGGSQGVSPPPWEKPVETRESWTPPAAPESPREAERPSEHESRTAPEMVQVETRSESPHEGGGEK